jgi:WD40 repeat protein
MRTSAGATAVRFSPDGRLVAAGTTRGAIVLFDADARRQLGDPLQGHAGQVFSVAFQRDGHHLVSAGNDGRVLLWDVEPWADEKTSEKRACDLVGRNLTRSEWRLFVPGKSYARTCDEWPPGS